jgi:maltooligosyltrehalose trehalohydrolase
MGPFPDPVSRFQPEGVHGLSQAIDFSRYTWKHANPPLPPPARRSIYEMHVGTFTPEGTFVAAIDRLKDLKELGVHLIELMPVADFPGKWNWGYDGVSIFAPARCYGTPEDLCALIDAAHGWGLGVLMDVVYNHFGPDGNYTGVYSESYADASIHTPWGAAMNFGGVESAPVRAFFRENAVSWIRDYRCDGLRLDATHAIRDESDRHILEEIASACKQIASGGDKGNAQDTRTVHGENASSPIANSGQDRTVLIYAEEHRNLAQFLKPVSEGGFDLEGAWADDWHHHLRRRLAGDDEGYFYEFDGQLQNIALTLRQGWFRDGSEKAGVRSQGESPVPFDFSKFVICLQNHDQVGNRALGERLHHQISSEAYRAASALLLLAPETPLLFMGQEWACTSPFQFFTDHESDLGKRVTEGRRKEFANFRAFTDPVLREKIPDPQDPQTFYRSRLNWSERMEPEFAECLAWYQTLLKLRNEHPAMASDSKKDTAIEVSGDGLVMLRRSQGRALIVAVCLEPSGGKIFLPEIPGDREWTELHTSETFDFAGTNSLPIEMEAWSQGLELHFRRPGAWMGQL